MQYKKWAIIFNTTKELAGETAQHLKSILEHLGAKADIFERSPASLSGFDAVATIGGDGTILDCVSAAVTAKLPVVGVNMGKLGYLASVDKNSMQESFKEILAGKYVQLPRNVLELQLTDGSKHLALNDVVVKSAEYRLAELRVSVDNELVTEYPCDGLIFSTPTGATAYNLSAGGPLIHLKVDGIVMTPICAHTLTERSFVFSGKSVMKIEHGKRHSPVHINADGKTICEGRQHLPILVREAKEKLVTLENPQHGQFEVLRKKLGW